MGGTNPQSRRDVAYDEYTQENDGKEHINHGMHEYTDSDLKNVHANYEEYHKNDEPETGINDWHTRHQDKILDGFCDNHPDAFECRVYDE